MPGEKTIELPTGFNEKPLARLLTRARNLRKEIEDLEVTESRLAETVAEMRRTADPRDDAAVSALEHEERKLKLCPGCIREATSKLDEIPDKIEKLRPKAEAAIRQIYGETVEKLMAEAIEVFRPWYGNEELTRAAAEQCDRIRVLRPRAEWVCRESDQIKFAETALALFETWRANGGSLPVG